jgi:hypothetical protein
MSCTECPGVPGGASTAVGATISQCTASVTVSVTKIANGVCAQLEGDCQEVRPCKAKATITAWVPAGWSVHYHGGTSPNPPPLGDPAWQLLFASPPPPVGHTCSFFGPEVQLADVHCDSDFTFHASVTGPGGPGAVAGSSFACGDCQ